MGILNTIKKAISSVVSTVKKYYTKADKALGGYLPGGITPSQAKNNKYKVNLPKTTSASSSKTASTGGSTYTYKYTPKSSSSSSSTSSSKSSSSSKNSAPDYAKGKPADFHYTPENSPELYGIAPGSVVQKIQQLTETQKQKEAEEAQARQIATSENGAWKKIVDVTKLAANVFTNLYRPQTLINAYKTLNDPSNTGLSEATQQSLITTKSPFRIIAPAPVSKVSMLAKVGTTGLKYAHPSLTSAGSTAETIATNTATAKATATMLTKIVKAVSNPAVVVGTIMAAIGTYPFAGFIKEEALQTLGLGVKAAVENNDLEGAQEAIQLQKEVLDPGTWDQIKQKVPFENVLTNLDDFYQAAKVKTAIDEKVVADLKYKQDNGETDAEFYARIEKERQARREAERLADEEYYAEVLRKRDEAREAQRIADEEYYAEIDRQKQKAREEQREEDAAYYEEIARKNRERELKQRAEDEKYWNAILAKRAEEEAAKRQAEEDYWNAYYKRLAEWRAEQAKFQQDNAPSQLKFGLL